MTWEEQQDREGAVTDRDELHRHAFAIAMTALDLLRVFTPERTGGQMVGPRPSLRGYLRELERRIRHLRVEMGLDPGPKMTKRPWPPPMIQRQFYAGQHWIASDGEQWHLLTTAEALRRDDLVSYLAAMELPKPGER